MYENWNNVDCELPPDKTKVQITYVNKERKELSDVIAMYIKSSNQWVINDTNGDRVPFKEQVIAWQFIDDPYELEDYEENRYKINVEYLQNNIMHKKIEENKKAVFGGFPKDTVYFIKPMEEKDINVINGLYLAKRRTILQESPLKKNDLGKVFVMICSYGDLDECDELILDTYDNVIIDIKNMCTKYQHIFDE